MTPVRPDPVRRDRRRRPGGERCRRHARARHRGRRAAAGATVERLPVSLCPGREKRARGLMSICSRSPGHGHSNRRTCSRAGLGARDMPAPRQTAADGRVRHPELARDQPGSPTGALPRLADPIVHGVADASGLPVRRRRLVVRPRAAGALGFRRSAIARDPVLDRGDTDTTPARRFAARHPPSRQRPTNSTRCHAGSHLRLHCIRLMTSEDRGSLAGPQLLSQPGCPDPQLPRVRNPNVELAPPSDKLPQAVPLLYP